MADSELDEHTNDFDDELFGSQVLAANDNDVGRLETARLANESWVRLRGYDRDNCSARANKDDFWRYPGPNHDFAGSIPDLDDREYEWNDRIRSVILYGPAGTTVRLYNEKNYGKGPLIEIKMPDNATELRCNNLNVMTEGMKRIRKGDMRGEVSGIKWM